MPFGTLFAQVTISKFFFFIRKNKKIKVTFHGNHSLYVENTIKNTIFRFLMGSIL